MTMGYTTLHWRVLPGDSVAWDYEDPRPESGPSGIIHMMEGTVLLIGENYGGRGFWVKPDDNEDGRQFITTILTPQAWMKRREEQ